MNVEAVLDEIIRREGPQYTDHPDDRGGPTKYGITLAVLAQWRGRPVTPGEVKELREDDARAIYRKRYVQDPGFDQVGKRSPEIAFELVDTGVNMGVQVAGTFLQTALNVLNLEQRIYGDVPVDGNVGPRSLAALDAFLKHRGREGATVLLKALNCLQGARYIEIARNRPSQEGFLYGWIAQRIGI